MWIIKFENWHKDCLLRPLCLKYNVTDLVYLINSWKEKKRFYYTELHILQGREEDKKKFIQELRKQKSTKKLEQKGNYIFTLNSKPITKEFYSVVFDPKIIQTKPVIQKSDGSEHWELASWDRETLMKVHDIPDFKIKLKSIQKTKLGDIFLPHVFPKLSPKQKQAIELAVNSGYYEYPRKIDLEKLAKLSKVKRQTFQENLRKAEKKLIPFLTDSLN